MNIGRLAGFAFALAAAAASGQVVARPSDGVWSVEGRLLGEPKDDDGRDARKARDVSGLACAAQAGFPRICVLADDETQGAQIVVLEDGRLVAGDVIRLTYGALNGEALELDAEGVAHADGSFYVIGSHGRPRFETDAAEAGVKARATRHVFRLRFDSSAVDARGRLTGPVEIASADLSRFLAAEPELAPAFDGVLKDNGLTIEGVAVRDGRLLAGLRGPILADGSAAILSIPLDVLFEGRPGTGRLHRVDLGKGRGVRDLVPFEAGFLVLAGPVNDPPEGDIGPGDYAVMKWDGGPAARSLAALPSFGRKVKPEALVPLDRANGRLRLLLLFDGPDEGAPRPFEIDLP